LTRLRPETLERYERTYELVLADALDLFGCNMSDLEEKGKQRWKVRARTWVVRVALQCGVPYHQTAGFMGMRASSARRLLENIDRYWPNATWHEQAKKVKARL
jgi:hypothetical protein